jgi:hypothetical protein
MQYALLFKVVGFNSSPSVEVEGLIPFVQENDLTIVVRRIAM